MSDLLKGLTGGGWAGLFAWIVPCALAIGLFALLFHGRWSSDVQLLAEFAALTLSEQVGAVAAIATSLGFVLSAVYTPLYRLLEGYSLPGRLRRRLTKRQLRRKHKLRRAVDFGSGWERALKEEELALYPIKDEQVAPTRLGNAFRSFETYGKTRFNLDSQTLWNELMSVAPQYLQTEYDRARAFIDFFVALIYLDFAMGVIALGLGIYAGFDLMLSAYGVLSIGSCFLFYNMAISSSTYLSATVQALVNIGRIKLADELGLELPATLAEEREMWEKVTVFVAYGEAESGTELDPYRKQSPGPASAPASADDAAEAGDEAGDE